MRRISDDKPAGKGHRVQRIVLKEGLTAEERAHVDELVRSVIDNLYLDPPMPPRYRARYERLEREASERKKVEGEDAI